MTTSERPTEQGRSLVLRLLKALREDTTETVGLTSTLRTLLIMIADRADNERGAWEMAWSSLARATGRTDKKNIKRDAQRLVDLGWITIHARGSGDTNTIAVCSAKVDAAHAEAMQVGAERRAYHDGEAAQPQSMGGETAPGQNGPGAISPPLGGETAPSGGRKGADWGGDIAPQRSHIRSMEGPIGPLGAQAPQPQVVDHGVDDPPPPTARTQPEPPRTKAKPKATRKVPIPDDWVPSAEERDVGLQLGMTQSDIDGHLAEFKDHYRAHGKGLARFGAGFRNWLRKAERYGQRSKTADPMQARVAGIWVELYPASTRYRGRPYVRNAGDDAVFADLARAAREAVVAHPLQDGTKDDDRIVTLTKFWIKKFLGDDGPWLVDNGHPPRLLLSNLSKYGLPPRWLTSSAASADELVAQDTSRTGLPQGRYRPITARQDSGIDKNAQLAEPETSLT